MLHQMLLSRLIAAASALIFSVLSFVAPPQRVADEGTVVRVGLCFGETAKRSITVRASGGFTLGRAEEDGWTALLTTECETIVVSRRLARPVTGESRYKNASAAAEAAAQSGGTVLYENGAYAVAEGLSPADAEPLVRRGGRKREAAVPGTPARKRSRSQPARAIEFPGRRNAVQLPRAR